MREKSFLHKIYKFLPSLPAFYNTYFFLKNHKNGIIKSLVNINLLN